MSKEYNTHNVDILSGVLSKPEISQPLIRPIKTLSPSTLSPSTLSPSTQTFLNELIKKNPNFSMNSYKNKPSFLMSQEKTPIKADKPNNKCQTITITIKGNVGQIHLNLNPKILTPKIAQHPDGTYFIDSTITLSDICEELKTQLTNITSIIYTNPFNPFNPEKLKTAYETLKKLIILKGIKIRDSDLQKFLVFLNTLYKQNTKNPLFTDDFLSDINYKNNFEEEIITTITTITNDKYGDFNKYKQLVEKYYSIPSQVKLSDLKKQMFFLDKTLEDLITSLLDRITTSNLPDINILKSTMILYVYGNITTLPGTPQNPNNNDEDDKGYLQQKFLEMKISQYKPSEKLKEIFEKIFQKPENACITTNSEDKTKWIIPDTLFTPIAEKIGLDRPIKANILANRKQDKVCTVSGGRKSRKLNKNKLKRKKTKRYRSKKQRKTHKRR
jgi:hypothetical protein